MKKIYTFSTIMVAMLSLCSLEGMADNYTKKLDYMVESEPGNVKKYTYTYDQYGNVTSKIKTNNSNYSSKRVYESDANHNMTKEAYYNYTDGSWVLSYYNTYEYTGSLKTKMCYYNNLETLSSTTTYSYNTANKIQTEISSSTYGTVTNMTKIEYSYDDHGNIAKEEYFTKSGTESSWTISYSTTYTNSYDTSGRLTKTVTTSSSYSDTQTKEYIYDTNGNISEYKSLTYLNDAISSGKQYLFTYNAQGDISNMTYNKYSSGSWTLKENNEYSYSNILLSSLTARDFIYDELVDEFYEIGKQIQLPTYAPTQIATTTSSSESETFTFSYSDFSASAITTVQSDKANGTATAIYSIDGKQQSSLQPGLNIVKSADGKVQKIFK